MLQDNAKLIHRIYQWVLAVCVGILGILLILSCLNIYRSADQDPYSVATIALHFQKISVFVYVTLLAIVGGIAIDILLPIEGKRPKATVQEKTLLDRLHRKASLADAEVKRTISRNRTRRIIMNIFPCILFSALMVYPFFYFTDPRHFSIENLNADIIKGILIALIPALIGLGLFYGAALLIRRNIRKEIRYLKQSLKEISTTKTTPSVSDPCTLSNRATWFIRSGIVLLAALLIVIGIKNGGANDVLKKAVAICTECIGLG